MDFLKIALYPYQRANDHFKAAAQLTMWEGRWAVHYVVGCLERIPILNYLIVLVDLVVSAFFQSQKPVVPGEAVPPPMEILTPPNVESFLAEHQIELEDSELAEEIAHLQEQQKTWTEEETHAAWAMRVRGIKGSINSLIDVWVNKKVLEESRKKLENIKEKLNKEGTDIKSSFEEYRIELESISKIEKKQKEECLLHVQEGFSKLAVPTFRSLKEYLTFLVIENYSLLGCRRETFKERGLETMADMDCLQLQRWNKVVLTLEQFAIILNHHSPSGSQKSSLRKACANFLNGFFNQLTQETKKDFFNVQFQVLYDDFLREENKLEEALRGEFSLDSLSGFIVFFKDFNKKWQIEELKAYLGQQGGHGAWQSIKLSEPTMTLAGYCNLHGITEPSQLYQLDVAFNPS